MPEIVTTPISFFEVQIDYKHPSVRLWLDRAEVIEALFNAFQLWDISVDDVEVITTGKPSEQGIKFKILSKRATFFFGPSYCRFSRDSTSWETAEETIKLLDTGFNILTNTGKIAAKTFKTVVALHLQPTIPFMDILKKIVPAPMATLDTSKPKTMACVLVWEGRKVTIDGSGQLANGIFVRYEREFQPSASYLEIAQQLRLDEEHLFAMLDIREA